MVEVQNDKHQLGTNMHLILKEYFKLIGAHPTKDMIENVAKSCFAKHFDNSLKNILPEAEEMLRNFVKFEISRIPKYTAPVMVEQQIEDETFNGIIDFFDGTKVIDWTTGKILTLGDNECVQGKVYSHLLASKGYSNVKVYFVTLMNGRCLEMPATTEQWLLQKTQKMFSMIQAGQYPKCKSGLCSWCSAQIDCEFDSVLELWSGIKCLT